MTSSRRWSGVVIVAVCAASACTDNPDRDRADAPPTSVFGDPTTTSVIGKPTTTAAEEQSTTIVPPAMSPLRDLPLPAPVPVREQPDGVMLADPAFEPLPGADAEFGTLGGAAYQIEVPDDWNGRLLLWMHGFEDFAPEAAATAPDFRRYLISHGFAWAASSFSSTSLIPSRAADETAALWDYFVSEHGRPSWTYVGGQSMGGWAAHIAAERYGNRFDGALGLCGAVGTTPGLRIGAELFVTAAYVAGVTQDEFDAATDIVGLIEQRIRPALADPQNHARFEDILIDLTGGPRAFDREGIHLEEETNWRRATLGVSAQLFPPRDAAYQLRPDIGVSSEEFNRDAIRLPTNDAALSSFAEGMEVTGDLAMPLVTLHTTGDGQVPIDQAQILRRRVDAAGRGDLLVERVIEDAGHCGFSTAEQEAALEALVVWVERELRPEGTNLDDDDLRSLDRTFELQARPGTPEADTAAGASRRAVVSGQARLDGAAFDARWLGAVVRDEGLVTPCQTTLPPVDAGHYEITVYGDNESAGCGRPGAEILLWTFAGEQIMFATTAIPWPGNGVADVDVDIDVDFATSAPRGAAREVTEFSGAVYRADGERVAPGARVEAYVGDTLCGVASIRDVGSFVGYILSVVGPDSVPGCDSGGHVTFHVDGAPASETALNSPEESTELDLTIDSASE